EARRPVCAGGSWGGSVRGGYDLGCRGRPRGDPADPEASRRDLPEGLRRDEGKAREGEAGARGGETRDGHPLNIRRLTATGHLIDSGMMSKYLDVIVENGGAYQLHRFDIGKTVRDFSTVELTVRASNKNKLELILDRLVMLG